MNKHRPKLILMPAGALIAMRLLDDEKNIWDNIKANTLEAIINGSAADQIMLEKAVTERLIACDLYSEAGLQQTSPEIKSLAKIGVGENDEVVLYASETAEGVFTARVVRRFIEETWLSTATIVVIAGLQVREAGRFRSLGVQRYVQHVVRLINKGENQYGREIILNTTAGFKSLVPYTTLIGLLFRIPVEYIFENSSELLSLPPLPVNFDQEFFRKVEPILKRIELNTSLPQEEVLKSILPEDRDALLPLLEQVDGEYTLSALGVIVYERYKAAPALLPSGRKPAEKDHTRDFTQETHRSTAFEEFKSRLADCEWVDEFWYMKGADDKRRDVRLVGDELHVAYGGVELRVKTTATHDTHYAQIMRAVENLM